MSQDASKKRSPSPPHVAIPAKKPKQPVLPVARKRERRRSLSSVSSISSSDLSDYDIKENKRQPRQPRRSRSRSPYRRYVSFFMIKFAKNITINGNNAVTALYWSFEPDIK